MRYRMTVGGAFYLTACFRHFRVPPYAVERLKSDRNWREILRARQWSYRNGTWACLDEAGQSAPEDWLNIFELDLSETFDESGKLEVPESHRLSPHPTGGLTVCTIRDQNGCVWGVGEAYCSLRDQFCRRIGRDISFGRAWDNLVSGQFSHHIPADEAERSLLKRKMVSGPSSEVRVSAP